MSRLLLSSAQKWLLLAPLCLSSQTSSKRKPLKTLLTTRLSPLTRGRQQVAARV